MMQGLGNLGVICESRDGVQQRTCTAEKGHRRACLHHSEIWLALSLQSGSFHVFRFALFLENFRET
jgi:hypothetical protein